MPNLDCVFVLGLDCVLEYISEQFFAVKVINERICIVGFTIGFDL